MNKFEGFLFSKLHGIGTRSEGPAYFLQQFDYSELPIEKETLPWQEDPKLQKKLATKVMIDGKLISGTLHYDSIGAYKAMPPGKKGLKVELKPETEDLWLNKMPPSPPLRPFKLTLEVQWPFKSIWSGMCPTSQHYDFFVEFKDQIIWRWSKGKFFSQIVMPVRIEGGSPYTFSETWTIDPAEIKSEGLYTVRGIFIPSGQESVKKVRIRFAV
jgi:hypothetical protein